MDFLKSKQDLETMNPKDLKLLANYYNIYNIYGSKNGCENDCLWLLAISIL